MEERESNQEREKEIAGERNREIHIWGRERGQLEEREIEERERSGERESLSFFSSFIFYF